VFYCAADDQELNVLAQLVEQGEVEQQTTATGVSVTNVVDSHVKLSNGVLMESTSDSGNGNCSNSKLVHNTVAPDVETDDQCQYFFL